jgi:hypothetical protein
MYTWQVLDLFLLNLSPLDYLGSTSRLVGSLGSKCLVPDSLRAVVDNTTLAGLGQDGTLACLDGRLALAATCCWRLALCQLQNIICFSNIVKVVEGV